MKSEPLPAPRSACCDANWTTSSHNRLAPESSTLVECGKLCRQAICGKACSWKLFLHAQFLKHSLFHPSKHRGTVGQHDIAQQGTLPSFTSARCIIFSRVICGGGSPILMTRCCSALICARSYLGCKGGCRPCGDSGVVRVVAAVAPVLATVKVACYAPSHHAELLRTVHRTQNFACCVGPCRRRECHVVCRDEDCVFRCSARVSVVSDGFLILGFRDRAKTCGCGDSHGRSVFGQKVSALDVLAASRRYRIFSPTSATDYRLEVLQNL